MKLISLIAIGFLISISVQASTYYLLKNGSIDHTIPFDLTNTFSNRNVLVLGLKGGGQYFFGLYNEENVKNALASIKSGADIICVSTGEVGYHNCKQILVDGSSFDVESSDWF